MHLILHLLILSLIMYISVCLQFHEQAREELGERLASEYTLNDESNEFTRIMNAVMLKVKIMETLRQGSNTAITQNLLETRAFCKKKNTKM